LKASSRPLQLSTVNPGTVAPVQTLSPSQQALSVSAKPTKAPVQLPLSFCVSPSCSVAATFKSAAVHWRISCVSLGPRILPSVPTEQSASVVETVLPAITLVSGVPQTSSGSRLRLRGSLPVIRNG